MASILAALDEKGGWWMVEASMSAANIGDKHKHHCYVIDCEFKPDCHERIKKSSVIQRHVCLFSLTNNSKILLISQPFYMVYILFAV